MLQPNKPEYSARFRHSSLLGWVCLFAAGGGGGGGICESIEIPTSLCLYSIGFKRDGDLPDGNLFSVCVLFTLALSWVVYWQCDICPWPFSYIFHVEVGVLILGLMAMQS